MNRQSMEPFGRALVAFFSGDSGAEITIRRDDGKETPLPAAHFFRDETAFTAIERAAMDCCEGTVLDIGAGTGLMSVALSRRGHAVTALDISSDAASIAKQRGVVDVVCNDIFEFKGGPYDTLLMIGHGIGMVETIEGLQQFLIRARSLLAPAGRLLLDSLDVRATTDEENLAYHEANRRAGRYFGETRIQFEFRKEKGPYCGWLHVDAATLGAHAKAEGWRCEVLQQGEFGDYVARLTNSEEQARGRSFR